MSLPEPEEIERLAIGDLRALVTSLLAEEFRLRAENAALREEIARLKGLPPRPKLKPSGMEQASKPPAPRQSGKPKRKRRRGAKRDHLAVGARETRDGRMQEVEIRLSDWVFNAIRSREVLTLHRDYFRLRKPLERRIYELARWVIS